MKSEPHSGAFKIDDRVDTDSPKRTAWPLALRLTILLVVSIGFESLFIGHGLNPMDEGWPLHAAMEMHDGKTLYEEVFWVFPPGHVLPAWVGYGIAPPGVVGARIIYGAFNVVLCLSLFFVARRFMPDDFALLAGLMVAIAAPESHGTHLLFGYRYLVWSAIVLLLFYRRLTSGDSRWLFAAGVLAGIALFFRVTPAFAVSAAVGIGIMASTRDYRRWFTDGLWYAAGLILFWIPVLIWFHQSVGLERFWIEMIVRPVEMTELQSKPFPPLFVPTSNRYSITVAFNAICFRLYIVMYFVLTATLLYRWARSVWARRPFDDIYLFTFVIFGVVYFFRGMGRSDIPHLDSAIPPVIVLVVFSAYVLAKSIMNWPWIGLEAGGRKATLARWVLFVFLLSSWSYLNSAERFLDRAAMMGNSPLASTHERVRVRMRSQATIIDKLVADIQAHSTPEDTILVMAHAPLIYVLADRHSPGFFDLLMPGTFRDPAEEEMILDRLEANPPAVVVWPRQDFDQMPSRGLKVTAPRLRAWALQNYQAAKVRQLYVMMLPKSAEAESLGSGS